MSEVSLRPVREEDCRLLWEWANDPEVRRQSWNSAPISWEEHVQWFQQKLTDSSCAIYLAVNNLGQPVGQVRFDVAANGQAEVSVSMDASFRGKGYGTAAIEGAAKLFLGARRFQMLTAFIKPDNRASVRAFEKAGFEYQGLVRVHDEEAIRMKLRGEKLSSGPALAVAREEPDE
ncbi:MAG: GNAT family N-acetyltransferase [Chloroflexi bacterium]|nr:GNAT family N-acetyltransferase [Chloroflexota bacterium]